MSDDIKKEEIKKICGIDLPGSARDIYYLYESLFTLNTYIRFTSPTNMIQSFLSSNKLLPQNLLKGESPLSGWTVTNKIETWWHPERLKNTRGGENSFTEGDFSHTWYIISGKDLLLSERDETIYIVYVLENIKN